MEVKPGYKLTEVGVIPEDWECCPISSVAQLESGHTPTKRKKSYWDGAVGWVSLHDTARLDGNEIHTTTRTITEEGVKNSSARMLPKGTVVFSRTATVGKATTLGRDMTTSQDFANYICGPDLNNIFLVYLFRGMKRTWAALMAGSIHNTIYMPAFKSLNIARPPIDEQRAIAKALSDVDALLSALDRLITKKRDLKQAAMQQLLTGKTRLPGFCGEWKESKLGELGAVYSGLSGKSKADFGDGNSHYVKFLSVVTRPIVKGDDLGKVNVKRGEAQAEIAKGDLLFNGSSETPDEVALCALVDFDLQDVFLNSFCFGYRLNADCSADGLFLTYLIRSEVGRSVFGILAQGSTRHNISKAAFREVVFKLPHLSEQLEIVRLLREMDAEIAVLEYRRQKTNHLKQGMMQELLTGKTRLVEPETYNA